MKKYYFIKDLTIRDFQGNTYPTPLGKEIDLSRVPHYDLSTVQERALYMGWLYFEQADLKVLLGIKDG